MAPQAREPNVQSDGLIRRALLAGPVILILSSYVIFQVTSLVFDVWRGYLAAFLLYWLTWGVGFPLLIVGRHGFVDLFRQGGLRWGASSAITVLLLAGPPLLGFLFVFPGLFPSAGERAIVALAAYALVNGTLEEVFWRGTFARVFPNDAVRGFVYPAVAFGIWHVTLVSLFPHVAPVDRLVVFIAAFAVGILYGWVAWRTGSIRYTVLSHVLTNLSGIGALLIFWPTP